MSSKRRVLFVCTANAARSQIAEALLRNMRPDTYEVYSAGTHPTGVDNRALKALEDVGVTATGLRSKSVHDFRGQHFDHVIALCDKSATECQSLASAGEFITWDFADPQASGRQATYDKTLGEIRTRIQMFLLVSEKDKGPGP